MAWEWTVLGSTSISVLHWLSKQCCADINFSVNKLISSVNKALSRKPLCAVSSHAWLGSYPLPACAVVRLAGTGNQEAPGTQVCVQSFMGEQSVASPNEINGVSVVCVCVVSVPSYTWD